MVDAAIEPTGYDGAPALKFNDAEWRMLSVLLDRQLYMRMAGLQFDGRRNLYDIFGYDRLITSQQYRDEYARGGIAKRIVDAFPKATWRGGVELYEDEDPKVSTPFEKTWAELEKKYGVWNKLLNADILAGQSTYSAILIGAPGNLDEELPRGTKMLYLQPFFGGGGPGNQATSPSARMQASTEDVTIETFDVDTASERFGEPLTYRIRRTDLSSPMLARPVHWSRIIHICEGALDNNVYGVPTLESIWNLLFNLDKITGGGSESFFQRAKHTLNANIQKDATFMPSDVTALKDKLEEYMHGITNIIPTREVDLKLIEGAVANFALPADAIIKQIAGSKGIPMRILTGSEMGTLASEQDAANFDSQVQDRRTGYAGPMIVRKLVDRLIAYGYLPEPKQYEVGWPVEESMDEAGKASFALNLANVNKTHDGVVFTEDEIRDMAFDLEPLPKTDSSENLSESQKADIAFKLAGTNKAMGITVFTDDEIRKITYGFSPLSDSEKVPIGAPERISVTQPPELGEDGLPVSQPVVPGSVVPTKPAMPITKQLAALEAAIEDEDLETIGVLLGLGDSSGHEFHGNQWTSGKGSNPKQYEGRSHGEVVVKSKLGHVQIVRGHSAPGKFDNQGDTRYQAVRKSGETTGTKSTLREAKNLLREPTEASRQNFPSGHMKLDVEWKYKKLSTRSLETNNVQDAINLLTSNGNGTEDLVLAKRFISQLGAELLNYDNERLSTEFEAFKKQYGTGFDGRRDA